MRYNRELQSNNAELQAILDSVNGLPSAGGGDDYLELSNVVRFNDLNLFNKKELTLNLNNLITCYLMFSQTKSLNTTVEHITVNSIGVIDSCANMFHAPSKDFCLKYITLNLDFSNCESFASVFGGLNSLEIIDGNPLDCSKVTNFGLAFNQNYALKEVRFVPLCINKNISFSHSSQLSDVSIQSIVDGLAQVETQQTLTFSEDVKTKIQANTEWLTVITSKNWTLA